jgi:hypothetical protein
MKEGAREVCLLAVESAALPAFAPSLCAYVARRRRILSQQAIPIFGLASTDDGR